MENSGSEVLENFLFIGALSLLFVGLLNLFLGDSIGALGYGFYSWAFYKGFDRTRNNRLK